MLLRNGANYWKAVLTSTTGGVTFSSVKYDGTSTNSDETAGQSTSNGDHCAWFGRFYWSNYSFYFPQINQISNGSTVFFENTSETYMASDSGTIIGTGDTPPSFDDYKLSGDMITTFTATVSSSTTINANTAKIDGNVTYTITNTGSDAFTIKEIGFCRRCHNGGGRVLLYRDVLTTPVTIEAGNTGVLMYTLSIG